MSINLTDDAWPGAADRVLSQVSLDDLHDQFVDDLLKRAQTATRRLEKAERLVLEHGDVLTVSEQGDARREIDQAAEVLSRLEVDLVRARTRTFNVTVAQ